MIYRESASSPFTLPQDAFVDCVGLLLRNFEKYRPLLDSIFEKLSYHNQACSCLEMHFVYSSRAEAYHAKETTSPYWKAAYEERESEAYREIIARYVYKYAERYCMFLLNEDSDENEFASRTMLYLYMEESFRPSLATFNEGISKWIINNPSQKAKVAQGYLRHLLTKVHEPSCMDGSEVYIPKAISTKLPSIFGLLVDIDNYSSDEQREIEKTIQQILPRLQEESQGANDALPFRRNPYVKGAPEVIECMQSCLSQLAKIRQVKEKTAKS